MTVGLLGAACTDESIVFRDRSPFNPPADQVNGFLGYLSLEQRATTCGSCHVERQAEWAGTLHSVAFSRLVASGEAQDFCFNCHTVNERGNAVTGAAAWTATRDSAYEDVQCEACHGPGIEHIQAPDATRPLASINVGSALTDGCGECHMGNHQPFVQEWERSAHATPVPEVIALAQQTPEEFLPCLSCHTAQGALQAWGVRGPYPEQDAPVSEHLGITCAVCHDPHSSPNTAQLRFPIDVPSREQNLCIRCHSRRAQPEVQSELVRGPHSPEGPLLLGEGAGWFPPGFQPQVDRILSTHGTIANPRTCATCHVARFTVTDQETGQFQFQATGHLFLAIPCVDAAGIPGTNQDCDLTQRSFGACATGGCHASPDDARADLTGVRGRLRNLITQVDSLLAEPGPASDFNRFDGVFTVADGSWFNARLAELPGTATHNPFLAEALLNASIDAIKATYGLP